MIQLKVESVSSGMMTASVITKQGQKTVRLSARMSRGVRLGTWVRVYIPGYGLSKEFSAATDRAAAVEDVLSRLGMIDVAEETNELFSRAIRGANAIPNEMFADAVRQVIQIAAKAKGVKIA